MITDPCLVRACERRAFARGLCNSHYKESVRLGEPLPPRIVYDLMRSFWSRVQKGAGCWEWTGNVSLYGYGILQPKRGVSLRAHRIAWEDVNGPVPDGLVLDHLCRNRACVRPDHLEAVTVRENTVRGIGPSAINAARTACSKGHDYTDENTRIDYRGRRVCRACDQIRFKARNAALKAERAARRLAA